MNQKNPKELEKSDNKNDSNVEIFDIEQQIEQAETDNSTKEETKVIKTPDSLEKSSNQELIEELKNIYKQLEEKDGKYNQLYSRYLRALADYENLEKRSNADKTNIIKRATENLVLKLLDLADTFEKAHKSISEKETNKLSALGEGFNAVHSQFLSILKNEGVERIQSIGEIFDPNFHEAVFVKTETDKKENTILEEVQAGYLLNSLLIRPTKVIIAKNEIKGEK